MRTFDFPDARVDVSRTMYASGDVPYYFTISPKDGSSRKTGWTEASSPEAAAKSALNMWRDIKATTRR